MNHKKIELYFEDNLARFEAELHDHDAISIVLTEFERNESKSTNNHDYFEPRSTTEVFLDLSEVNSIVKALQFLIEENDVS